LLGVVAADRDDEVLVVVVAGSLLRVDMDRRLRERQA